MDREITLLFKSLEDLWSFRIEALIIVIEMDETKMMLTGKCSKDAVQTAVSKYKASIVLHSQGVEYHNPS